MENKDCENSNSDDDADMFCPALPPHLLEKKSRPKIIGPTLPPPNYIASNICNTSDIPDKPFEEETDDKPDSDQEDIPVGPLPSSIKNDKRFDVPEMEYRMKSLIEEVSGKNDNEPKRESWMLELPSDKPNILALGLGCRQFRKKNVESSGDRSVWTDTPEDKARKEMKSKNKNDDCNLPSVEDIAGKQRDNEFADFVSQYNDKKRNVPLIDLHKKKKAKKDESKRSERKPFSREEDLHVNKFDEAQKATILKKARQLDDRFSSGNRKFL